MAANNPASSSSSNGNQRNGTGNADSSDEFLRDSAGFSDVVDELAPSQQEPEPEPAPAFALDVAMLEPAIGATFHVIFAQIARASNQDVWRLQNEEQRDLEKAWAPVAKFYLEKLGQGALWAAPAMTTGAILLGKKAAAEAMKPRTNVQAAAASSRANTQTPASPGSSAFSENATAEKHPTFGAEFGNVRG